MNISVVMPAYNEGENIRAAVQEVVSVLEKVPDLDKIQVLVVDDYSSDNTYEAVCRLNDPRIGCLRLSRRCGSHTALRAGMRESKADAVLCISADGQDSPAVIEDMLLKWRDGARVVWALRKNREDEPWYMRRLSRAFYRLLFWLTDVNKKNADIDLSRAGFFLLDRNVVEAINACGERNTSLFGLISWVGFKQDFVEYGRRLRRAGSSKWSFESRLNLAKDWIIAFSGLPLRITSLIGIFIAVIGIIGAIYVVLDKLFFSNIIAGWASIVVLILFLSGVQLTILGIMGEYLWRNLDESRKRPLFFIEKKSGEDLSDSEGK
jgi:dolichol-phosphate mannosyltransferase